MRKRKVRASKEECAIALKALGRVQDSIGLSCSEETRDALGVIGDFLEAARRRLPSEAAYDVSAARAKERAQNKRRA